MLKMVPKTPLQFGVAERLSRTFREESTRLRAEAPKMLWADSLSTAYLIYRIPYVLIGLRIPEVNGEGSSGSDEMSTTDSSSLTKPIQKIQVDIPENHVENDSIVAEHGLSSEITQSPGGNSNTSEGSENNESFEDSGISNEKDSEDRAFSEEGGSETPQKAIIEDMVSLKMNDACSLVRLLARKNASQSLWMFMVKEEHDGSKRYKARLMVKGFQQKRGVDYNEIFSSVGKMTTIRLVLSIVAAGAFLCESLE
ncbi:retrovirus-related pol polyprotein from transposon TNT 1-94 [Tanacetum coccineum]